MTLTCYRYHIQYPFSIRIIIRSVLRQLQKMVRYPLQIPIMGTENSEFPFLLDYTVCIQYKVRWWTLVGGASCELLPGAPRETLASPLDVPWFCWWEAPTHLGESMLDDNGLLYTASGDEMLGNHCQTGYHLWRTLPMRWMKISSSFSSNELPAYEVSYHSVLYVGM